MSEIDPQTITLTPKNLNDSPIPYRDIKLSKVILADGLTKERIKENNPELFRTLISSLVSNGGNFSEG